MHPENIDKMTSTIELSKINLFGYTHRLVDPGKIDRLIGLIHNNTTINPPIIAPYKEGYFCIEGIHRILSFKYLGRDKIQCIIDYDYKDIRLEMLKIAKNSFSELTTNCKVFQDTAIINSHEDGLSNQIISDILDIAFTPVNLVIRQHRKTLKDDKIQKGIDLIMQGHSIYTVAQKLGVNYNVFRSWDKYYEDVIYKKIDENKKDIIKLAIKGHNHAQIAEQVKIPRPFIRRWLNNQTFDFDTLLDENKIDLIKGES